jgi:hypothetical protein
MTIAQIGELLQRFVKNGVVRGQDTLEAEDYQDLAILARDYVIFEMRRGGASISSDTQVSTDPKYFEIKTKQVVLPKGYSVQGIRGMLFASSNKEEMDDAILPVDGGEKMSISDDIFTYAFITQNLITFRNLPQGAKYLVLYNIAGSSPDDDLPSDVAFLIFKECMKLGQISEEKRKDTSADRNNFDDYLQNQIKQFINAPNKIV